MPNRAKTFLSKIWREWLKPVVPLILVLLCIRSAVADWNDVPTGSMRPNILEGDRIFVNKLAYDLRIPFTMWRLAEWSGPARGDIAVLFSPADGIRLVKRVVAIPGDNIAMRDGQLVINGIAAHYDPIDAARLAELGITAAEGWHYYRETIDGRTRVVAYDRAPRAARTFGPITLGDDEYFVMGDNRDHSGDSRVFGLVKRSAFVGEATAIVASVDREHHYAPRWSRFFRGLE